MTSRLIRIRVEAYPTAAAQEDINIQGAFVIGWVKAASLAAARREATRSLKEEGWEAVAEEGFDEVWPELLAPPSEAFFIYQAALREGCIMVFFPWLDKSVPDPGTAAAA